MHEAYLRLVEQDHQNWDSRRHFFGVAAHLMRLILVDWARRARAGKRGGGARQVTLEDLAGADGERFDDFLALDGALKALEAMDPRKAKIIELRYFGGLTADETATAIGISRPTVERDTRLAQLFLRRHVSGDTAS